MAFDQLLSVSHIAVFEGNGGGALTRVSCKPNNDVIPQVLWKGVADTSLEKQNTPRIFNIPITLTTPDTVDHYQTDEATKGSSGSNTHSTDVNRISQEPHSSRIITNNVRLDFDTTGRRKWHYGVDAVLLFGEVLSLPLNEPSSESGSALLGVDQVCSL